MTRPSAHLTWAELACRDGTPYPQLFIDDGRCARLAALFEAIRAWHARPITVLSAYRTPSHNRRIGGARHSQHLQGRALDLRSPQGIPLPTFITEIRDAAADLGLRGLGLYPTFVHVDLRPTTRLVVWHGTGAKETGTHA